MKKLIILLIAAALVISGCATDVQPAPELLTPVGSKMDTVTAEIGAIEKTDIYEAAIIPEYHELYFTHEVRIGNIPVMLGDEVKKGDVLVEIDVSGVNGSIAQLESERADIEAEAEYEKAIYDIDMEIFSLEMKKLSGDAAYDKETDMAIYELEYQNAEDVRNARLAEIEAEIAELKLSLEDTALVSPCDGRVTYVANATGGVAGAYDTVCVVTDDSALSLKSSFIPQATVAAAAEIYAMIDGEKIPLHALQLNEDEYSRAMLKKVQYLTSFEAELPGDVQAGDTCVVYVVVNRLENVLRVPFNSVFSEDEEYYVYLVEGESRIKTGVAVGFTNNIYYEITGGIEEGDVVYVSD